MDDDLDDFDDLTSEVLGEDFGPSTSSIEPDESTSKTSFQQLKHGFKILWDPNDVFYGRDKAKVVSRGLMFGVVGLALSAQMTEWLGLNDGRIGMARSMTRDTVLQLFAFVGDLGMHFLNNPLSAAAVALLVALLMNRRG